MNLYSKSLSFLLAFLFPTLLFAQYIEWERNFGGSTAEQAYSVEETKNGGFIVAGHTLSSDGDVSSNNGNKDYWVLKLDASGALQWEKNYGGSSDEEARAIKQTSDDGFIVAGWSASNDGDVSGNKGDKDYWVLKLDPSGNIEWEQSYGGSGVDEGRDLLQTQDGGYIVAGSSASPDGDVSGNEGMADYWILKLDPSGNIEWDSNYGGSDYDEPLSIVQAPNGNYWVAGLSYSSDGDVSQNYGITDCWVLELSPNGSILQERNYGGSNYDVANSIRATPDHGAIVLGTGESTDGDVSGPTYVSLDYWVFKLDSVGDIEWEKTLGGDGKDNGRAIDLTADGGYILGGYTRSAGNDVNDNHGGRDFWIVKLDSSGSILWTKIYGGMTNDELYALRTTDEGGYITAGLSTSSDQDVSDNNGGADFWVLKLGDQSTGLSEENRGSFPLTVHPNPTEGRLRVDPGQEREELHATLWNTVGKRLKEVTLGETEGFELNIEAPPGLYLLELRTQEGERKSIKVLKR